MNGIQILIKLVETVDQNLDGDITPSQAADYINALVDEANVLTNELEKIALLQGMKVINDLLEIEKARRM